MIVGAMLVKNESGRWLEKVLTEMCKVCDTFVIVDDASTDNTVNICEMVIRYSGNPLEIYRSRESLWGTNEVEQRKRLWDMAISKIPNGGWILNLDADEVPVNLNLVDDITDIYNDNITNIDGIGFSLYDMWNDTHYRNDSMWTAHNRFWYMVCKYDPCREYIWNEQSLHCGRFPANAITHVVNDNYLKIKHMGWSRPDDRQIKYDRYMKADPEGKYGILEQYQSILDDNPTLEVFV